MAYNFKQDLEESQVFQEKLHELKGMCSEGHPTTPQVTIPFCKCISEGKTEVDCKHFLSKNVRTYP